MTFQFRPFDALLGNLGTLKINFCENEKGMS